MQCTTSALEMDFESSVPSTNFRVVHIWEFDTSSRWFKTKYSYTGWTSWKYFTCKDVFILKVELILFEYCQFISPKYILTERRKNYILKFRHCPISRSEDHCKNKKRLGLISLLCYSMLRKWKLFPKHWGVTESPNSIASPIWKSSLNIRSLHW